MKVLLLVLCAALALSALAYTRDASEEDSVKESKSGHLGGPESSEELNEDGRMYAERALEKMNLDPRMPHQWRLDRLLQVRKKVVAGIKYTVSFIAIETECPYGENVDIDMCKTTKGSAKKICTYDVYVRQWENFEDFSNRGCVAHPDVPLRFKEHPLRNKQEEKVTLKGDKLHLSKFVKPKDFAAWNLFNGFIDRYNRTYESKKETLRRFRIYKRNLRAVKMWQENEQGTAEYGETEFMDMTTGEFRETMLPYVWGKPKFPDTKADVASLPKQQLPDSVDWRQKGVVTDVKNQGQCGSCWAFSVTGNIEGQWAIKKGKLVSLSEQELVDCDIVDQGCNGGLPSNAYKEIIRMGGLEPEDQYPYEGHGDTCHLVRKDISVYINDSVVLPKDEKKIAMWLFNNGPISIGRCLMRVNRGTVTKMRDSYRVKGIR
uniref:Cysteine proteinase n=1 Tax=Steinernema glaseri TaxID=37863 RepID=A0A1I8ABL7_9BILA